MNPLIPSFEASKQRPNAKLIEFFFLFIILQFLHGFCSVHIVLFLNKMKLTRGVDVNMKGIMCYYLRQLWPRENKDGRLSNQNFFVFYMREGGGGVCKQVNMNMSNRKKSLSEGEKLILMQNDTTLLRQVFGINLNIHVQYSTVIKSCMLGPTVIGLCQ